MANDMVIYQVYNRTNEFVYLGGNVNHNADLFIEVDRRIRNAWCSFRKYTHKIYDRPGAPLELKIRMLRVEVLETLLYGCVTWSPRACHYDTLRRAHHRFLICCIGWRKHNRADHPISSLDTLIKPGSESIAATLRRRWVLFAGFVGGYETTEVRDVQRIVGGRGLCGRPEKRVDGVFPGRSQSFRHQRRPVDDCSPGRGGMAQKGWIKIRLLRKSRLDALISHLDNRVQIGNRVVGAIVLSPTDAANQEPVVGSAKRAEVVDIRNDEDASESYTCQRCRVEDYTNQEIDPHHFDEKASVNARLSGVRPKSIEPSPAQANAPSGVSGSSHMRTQVDIPLSTASTEAVSRESAAVTVNIPEIDGQTYSVRRDYFLKADV